MKNCKNVMSTNRFTTLIGSVPALAALAALSVAQAQPTLSNISPDGSHLFQPSATLSFNASSAIGVTNVSVALTSTTLPGASRVRTLTAAHGLTVTGPATNLSVTASLASNIVYSAVITATDANGAAASSTVNFDTITPAYTFEAEDFNYTSNSVSGLFINNPQTNAYAGLNSTDNVDAHNAAGGANAYRPNPPGLATEGNGDKTRVQYMGTGQTDYDVGWNNGGNFANYTRNFPVGAYNIYMRGANPNAVGNPSATLSGAVSGNFSVPNTGGWQNYTWVPLLDGSSNLIEFDPDGTAQTLTLSTVGGNYNANFYLLVPTNPPAPPGPALSAIYPDGVWQFEQTNTLTFSVSSSAGVDPSGITVQLSATNLNGLGSSQSLSAGNGLTLSGSASSWTVTASLASNKVYTAFIQVADINDNASSTTVRFDTLPTNYYTFEAEDFDYSTNGVTGGLFFDNSHGAYAGLSAIDGIDFNLAGTPNNSPYRGNVLAVPPTSLNTETAGDQKRVAYDIPSAGVQDYDLGNTSSGDWGNYTRTYPTGPFNLFVRASSGGNGGVSSMALVTSGLGTSNQTITSLGTFNIPGTGGWQTYVWVPLLDSAGNLVQFAGGSVQTLRFNNGGGINANYFMLAPADNSLPTITHLYPDGSSWYQYTNQLSFVASSSDGIAQSNITVTLDGTVVSGLVFGGSSTSWTVTYPNLTVNAAHTAVISVTTLTGLNKTATVKFDTFKPGYYTFEAEDFDYNGGHYFDNPQVDSYNGLAPIADVDNHQSDLNPGRGFAYRPNNDTNAPVPATGIAGDTGRPFVGSDYNIGFFGGGSWLNYTRHYPAGNYNVWGRFAEGAAPSELVLGLLTSGYGTNAQTTNVLGTFYIAQAGWSTWEWAPLKAANGQLATLTFDGSQATLKLIGSFVGGQPEVNVNFFMLAPSGNVTLQASRAANTTAIKFQTTTGFTYQVQYKNSLLDASWTNVGSAVAGDSTVHTVNDTTGAGTRFYRAQVSSQP